MPRVLAAADIGSNTAHLLVAATDGELVMRLDNYNEWIPLGEVVSRVGAIPKEIVQQLVLVVREFRRISTAKAAENLYVFATEGMRAASNHDEVLARIKEETGVTVDLISPQREAELSYRGIQLDTKHLPISLMLEVGGGSCQIGVVADGKLTEKQSLPLGTGRVIAESGLTTPCTPEAEARARAYIRSQLDKVNIVVTGGIAASSGGVGRGLWRAVHPDGEKTIARIELDYLAWAASRLTIDRIVNRFSVKQKRAGTLLSGALVYAALMDHFGLDEIAISEFGIREGAILEMFRKEKRK
jgi:exopolyphosphatase/guanosine-5'-triphosphate,3'-diphosphate pyrophosphatase